MKTIKSIKVSGGSLPDGFSAHVPTTIDYAGASEAQMKAWMDATVTIRLQRAWSKLTPQALEGMQKAGVTILAVNAGKKFESRDDQIARRTAELGGNRQLAVMAVDHPDEFMELMAQTNIPVGG
ncbi:hypothetical protein KAR91_34560 [Candidatus Pacearchaeota archaeon]|nr:hypothetical protein [Candidatus Pacearchaeota archaeon]